MSRAPAPGKPPIGRPPKHGSRALSRFIRENRLDRRTWLSRFIEQTEDVLASDQGGHEGLTHREGMAVTLCANLWTEWQLVQWHRQQAILKGKLTHDGDKYYLALVNALRRTLETLGLRPEKMERLPTLQDYLETHEAAKAAASQGPPTNGNAPATPPEDRPGAAPGKDGVTP